MYLSEREVQLLKDTISFFEQNQFFAIEEQGGIQQELDALNAKLSIYNQETFE